jgi:predicted small lipoprotein YifL
MTRLRIKAASGLALIILSTALTNCGKVGPLETAPAIFDKDGKPVKRENEKALPQAKDKNRSPDPYAGTAPISEAPLEGTGNAQGPR